MAKNLIEMAAEIIGAQATHSRMSAEEMSDGLEKVFRKLMHIKKIESGEVHEAAESYVAGEVEEMRTNPLSSIQRTKVVCIECGKEFKILTNQHLSLHGLTSKEYRSKYGMSTRLPLVAKSLIAKKRKSAIAKDLGRKLAEYRKKKKSKE